MSTQPDFVEGKQKSFWERCALNTGIVFISGWGIGSVTGFANGIRKSPSRRMKIVMNSGLNHAGRAGVKYGNMLACLTLYFSAFQELADEGELDLKIFGERDIYSFHQVAALSCAGAAYYSMTPPFPYAMAVGAATGAAFMGAVVVYDAYGPQLPFDPRQIFFLR